MKEIKFVQGKTIKRLVTHDIKCSRKYILCLLMVPLILILFSCFFLQRDVIRMTANGVMTGKASYADYLFRFMEGMPVFVAAGMSSKFEIPAVWLVFHWWLSYIVGAYVVKDIKCQGVNILLRIQSRSIWWSGKCIWSIAMVFLYYGFTMAIVLAFSIYSGDLSLTLTPVLHHLPIHLTTAISGFSLVTVGILLPISISAGLTLIQLAVTIWSNQMIGNLVIVILLMVSAYMCNPVLPGNYLMLLRNSIVIGSEGVSVGCGMSISIVFIVTAITVGGWCFKKYDVK